MKPAIYPATFLRIAGFGSRGGRPSFCPWGLSHRREGVRAGGPKNAEICSAQNVDDNPNRSSQNMLSLLMVDAHGVYPVICPASATGSSPGFAPRTDCHGSTPGFTPGLPGILPCGLPLHPTGLAPGPAPGICPCIRPWSRPWMHLNLSLYSPLEPPPAFLPVTNGSVCVRVSGTLCEPCTLLLACHSNFNFFDVIFNRLEHQAIVVESTPKRPHFPRCWNLH